MDTDSMTTYTAVFETGEEFLYALDPAGDACIMRGHTENRILEVPSTIEGHSVTSIGPMAFANLNHVDTIVCPHGITHVGKRAFSHCRHLRRIILPPDVRELDETWLLDCSQVEEVVLPGEVEAVSARFLNRLRPHRLTIGRGTRTITLPDRWPSCLKEIIVDADSPYLKTDGTNIYTRDGNTLVAAAVHVENCRILDGCREIASRAFAYNNTIRTLELPDSLEYIDTYAFLGSTLQEFIAPAHFKHIGHSAFMRCESLTRVELGEELLSIGARAFASCTALERITIPASTISIGRLAFEGCTFATDWRGDTLTIDPLNTHIDLDEHGVLSVCRYDGWEVVDVFDPSLTSYQVKPGTVRIGDSAFMGHQCIESIDFPDGMKTISRHAFKNCIMLRHISLPEGLVSIGEQAFFETHLLDVELPASVVELGDCAFAVEHRTLPSIKNLPPALTGFHVAPGNPRFSIRNGILCEKIDAETSCALLYVGPETDVEVPADVTHVAPYAFAGTDAVVRLVLHEKTKTVGRHGFDMDKPPQVIDLEAPEIDPRNRFLHANLVQDKFGKKAMRVAFQSGTISARALFEELDQALIYSFKRAPRACYLVRRLANPYYLAASTHRAYAHEVETQTVNICLALAEANWPQGYSHLADLGFLHADNIVEIIDKVSENGYVAMTAYLLQLKDDRFGADNDFDV